MSNPTFQEITREIMMGNFDSNQLNKIIEAVRFRRGQLGREVKRELSIGQTVKFYHPKLQRDVQGQVIKIKIKNVLVNTSLGRYNVPAILLAAV